ncbi:MAG: hypothetical protein Q9204_001346 [Flavoplaca sp. TL-2023a]
MFPPFAPLGGATYRTRHEPDTSPPKETVPPDFLRHKSEYLLGVESTKQGYPDVYIRNKETEYTWPDRQVLDPFDVEDPNNWFRILSVSPVRAIKVLASVPMDEDFGDDAEIAAVADAAEKRNAAKPSASSEKPKKVQQPAPQALRKRTGTSHSLVPARQRGNTVLSGIRLARFWEDTAQ